MAGGHAWWGVCMAGGACVVGGCAWQGGDMHGRKNGNCSGRYASYWNAFLLLLHPQKNSPHANWLQIGEYSDLVHLVLFGAESTHKV